MPPNKFHIDKTLMNRNNNWVVAHTYWRKKMTTVQETLGPAERIINTLLAHSDHMVHNRPGMVVKDAKSVTGVR